MPTACSEAYLQDTLHLLLCLVLLVKQRQPGQNSSSLWACTSCNFRVAWLRQQAKLSTELQNNSQMSIFGAGFFSIFCQTTRANSHQPLESLDHVVLGRSGGTVNSILKLNRAPSSKDNAVQSLDSSLVKQRFSFCHHAPIYPSILQSLRTVSANKK